MAEIRAENRDYRALPKIAKFHKCLINLLKKSHLAPSIGRARAKKYSSQPPFATLPGVTCGLQATSRQNLLLDRKGLDRQTMRSGKLFGQPPTREMHRPRVGHPPSTAAWSGTARSGNQVSDEGLDRVESGPHCPRVPGGDSLSVSLASARGLRTIAPNGSTTL